MFHVFRNTPLGRETLLQSIYFCKTVRVPLHIYVPVAKQFLMDFEHRSVRIVLDASYLVSPSSAISHVTQLAAQEGIQPIFFKSITLNFSSLPVIPTNFDFMCSPRCISDLPSKIGLNFFGPQVRRIIKFSPFPVFIARPGYKKWQNIVVFFGGSGNAVNALKLGLRIRRASGLPLDIFTHVENISIKFYEKIIETENLKEETNRHVNRWHVLEKGSFEENLYKVPHDALVVLGTHNYNPAKKVLWGKRKIKKIQTVLPNNLLIAGPKYTEPKRSLPA